MPVPDTGRIRSLAIYFSLLALTVGAFLAIQSIGSGLEAPAPAGTARFGTDAPAGAASSELLLHLLLALAAVIVAGQLLALVCRKIRQPAVIGEVLAGVLLGPSFLGRVAPQAEAFLLPDSVAPLLGLVSQLGIILYMFVVGLELDLGLLRQRGETTVAISHASIIVPFTLGAGLALGLYPVLSSSDVPFTSFALFLGVSLSVTAFPVLARILTDQRMHKTRLGVLALACAAIDDVTAWCLLAFVVGVARAQVGGALSVVALTLGYIVLALAVARPLLARMPRGADEPLSRATVALVLVGVLLSALVTELIGVHAVFGAFLLGAVIPHDSTIARQLSHRLEDLVTVLFLPAFFAFTGMRTEIGLVSGWEHWLICGLIIATATVGKFGGTLAAARVTGLGWRDSAALGILMNTRGLMELIVLNIGLDLGVISPTLFAMLVVMAIVTTVATAPILSLLRPASLVEKAPAMPSSPMAARGSTPN